VAFFAGAFLVVDVELLVDFFAGVDFLAAELLDVFLAADLVAVDLEAGDFLAVAELEDFLAGLDFVVVFLAVVVLEDFLAGLDFAVLDFLAGAFFAVDLAAVDFDVLELLADFFADPPPATTLSAAAAVLRTAGLATPGVTRSTAARVSLGSFLAPDTTSLSWAPGRNAGTAFFLALIRAPVAGLRTQRASRTRFSKEPNPVMATFSPLATSRVMVSSTESSAYEAALRLPSKRAARVSIN
jgi:hypothetical protein